MDVGRVVFSFCCLGALFGSSFSFCTSRCTVRRDKFSPVCLAHPLRCCKKKKKRQARQAAHHRIMACAHVFLASSASCSSLGLVLLPVLLHIPDQPFRALEAICYLLMSHLLIHQLQHLTLGAEIWPRTRQRLLTPPIRGLWAFRLCPPSAVCCWHFALAGIGDARAADAVILVAYINHAAANAVQSPTTSSLAVVTMRGLRRCVL